MGWRADARRASSAEDRRAHVLCPSLLATSDDHRRCSSCPLSSFFCRWSVKSLLTQLFTARKLDISTGQEPLVSTGFLPGTGRSVLNVTAFSTGRSDRYQMTQSSTGHQHRPVLKIFLSKKNQIASPVPHPFSLLFFFLSTIVLHLSSLFFKNRLLFFTNREKAVGRKEVCSRRKKISRKEGVRSRKSFT